MDVGKFKVSGVRLKAWLIIPPLLMAGVGLGSHAWQGRAQWRLQEAKALSEVLPPFIAARKAAVGLFEGFKTAVGGELGSEDQLISFLQDMAQQNDFMVDTVNVVDRKNQQQKAVQVINAVVRGKGDFTAIQLYVNEVKSEQRLISVDSIKIAQPTDISGGDLYDVDIVFELLLLDEMKSFNGGVQ